VAMQIEIGIEPAGIVDQLPAPHAEAEFGF
jgi:hypothetical protein